MSTALGNCRAIIVIIMCHLLGQGLAMWPAIPLTLCRAASALSQLSAAEGRAMSTADLKALRLPHCLAAVLSLKGPTQQALSFWVCWVCFRRSQEDKANGNASEPEDNSEDSDYEEEVDEAAPVDLTSPEGPKPATPPGEAPDLPFNVMLTCYTLFERVCEGVLVKHVAWCLPAQLPAGPCYRPSDCHHALPHWLPRAASMTSI